MIINQSGQLQDHPTLTLGRATPDATSQIPARHPDWAASYTTLGRTGLTCSAAGFGSYRVDFRVASHRAALAAALRMGVNIIDTSTNYAGGNSERLIGEVMLGLVKQDKVKREEIIIVSKAGYIQGELFNEMERRANAPHADYTAGSELTELVRHSQGLWHSIHPDFLRSQLTDSLERLQLETLDVFLLHNPEYYIQWAIAEGQTEQDVRDEYERRIKQAFTYLESEVAAGRIQYYGISSNTFPKSEGTIDRTSIERCWQHAEEVATELGLATHHFGVVQFPLNVFETGAVTEKNQKRGSETLMEFCREKNIGVLINRPLNAITGKQLMRLADFPEREVPPESHIDELVYDLKLQEEEFFKVQFEDLPLNSQAAEAVQKLLTLGRNLNGNWKEFASMEEWQDISATVLAPRVQYVFDVLRPLSQQDKGVFAFLTGYAETADEIFESISNYYSNRAYTRSQKIHQALDRLLPEEHHPLSLSQKAVLLVRSILGVSSVLVGMRSEEYVEDVVYGLQAKPVENVEEIWKRLGTVTAGS